jgi:glycosyltransferase involved in cell wall biosynthesis
LCTTSVVIPVRNGEKFVLQAIASVVAQLNDSDEIILVDDGSTDRTRELVATKYPGVRFIPSRGTGPSAGYNTGLLEARGSLVSFLDHDDWWPEHRHAVLLAAMDDHPDANAAFGRLRVAIEPEAGPLPIPAWEGQIVPAVVVSGIYRRDLLMKVGGFDERLNLAEDIDLHLRLEEAGLNVVQCEADTLIIRLHASNMTRNLRQQRADAAMLGVINERVRRRRALAAASEGSLAGPHAPHSDPFDAS